MDKTLFALFDNRKDVERIINRLKDDGYDPEDISLVMKDTRNARDIGLDTGADIASGAVSGATTGAILGGLAGLLSVFVLPGLGAFFIGGPIATALGLTGAAATTASGAVTGAAAGGLIGALDGLGLSREDAREYESRVKEGAILIAVPVRADEEPEVRTIFEEYGASNIKSVEFNKTRPDTGFEDTDYTQDYPGHTPMYGVKGGKTKKDK